MPIVKWTGGAALFLVGLTGVGCNAASATPTQIGATTQNGVWVLDVMNYSAAAVVVTPWIGAAKSTITCGDGVKFRDGSPGAPSLPWAVIVAVKADSQIVLD